MMNGENRQEAKFASEVRTGRFLSGAPMKREAPTILVDGLKFPFKIRKLQVLLDIDQIDWRSCSPSQKPCPELLQSLRTRVGLCMSEYVCVDDSVLDQAVELLAEWRLSPVPVVDWLHLCRLRDPPAPADRSVSFWTYMPMEDRHYKTRIVSGVVTPPKSSPLLPFVHTELTNPDTGEVIKFRIDDEDVHNLIVNGVSRETAVGATCCLMCEVCSVSCAFPVEASDIGDLEIRPATPALLTWLRAEYPSLKCSDCGRVYHAECVDVGDSFTDKAILHHLARTQLDWFCIECVEAARDVPKYGYEPGPLVTRREYERKGQSVAQSFGIKPTSSVEDVERTFWNLLDSDRAGNVAVLYASDLDSRDVAAGQFPTTFGYSPNPWDLRHLTLNPASVLQHLPGAESITGVSRPWMYLGSPFSAFCWHSEDQFLCSISFLHSGATKVWYTAAGGSRAALEEAITALLPDLVESNTTLHHDLVTMVNPRCLATLFGIPIGRVEQRPGEFIITFPQAYHCGFNCGVNLAEAVNVACPDWLPHGLQAVSAYSLVNRPPVFCVEKLLWNCGEAILAGRESRRAVCEFCVDTLEHLMEALAEFVHLRIVQWEQDEAIASCGRCRQFCYFVWIVWISNHPAAVEHPKIRCMQCAESGSKSQWRNLTFGRYSLNLRFSVERLKHVTTQLRAKTAHCTFSVRRSVRTPKRVLRLK